MELSSPKINIFSYFCWRSPPRLIISGPSVRLTTQLRYFCKSDCCFVSGQYRPGCTLLRVLRAILHIFLATFNISPPLYFLLSHPVCVELRANLMPSHYNQTIYSYKKSITLLYGSVTLSASFFMQL